jgi:hypothetical protein
MNRGWFKNQGDSRRKYVLPRRGNPGDETEETGSTETTFGIYVVDELLGECASKPIGAS